jgi:plastocyanin
VGTITVQIGGGDGNISLTTFSPNGLVIKAGSTITWTINEESGEPHVLVFFPTIKDSSGQPIYTGRAPDGGLIVNPAYRTASLPSGTTITTDTVKAATPRFTSGLLYGSSPNAQSAVPSQYTLTFTISGNYLYQDPFLPGNNLGAVQVVP